MLDHRVKALAHISPLSCHLLKRKLVLAFSSVRMESPLNWPPQQQRVAWQHILVLQCTFDFTFTFSGRYKLVLVRAWGQPMRNTKLSTASLKGAGNFPVHQNRPSIVLKGEGYEIM